MNRLLTLLDQVVCTGVPPTKPYETRRWDRDAPRDVAGKAGIMSSLPRRQGRRQGPVICLFQLPCLHPDFCFHGLGLFEADVTSDILLIRRGHHTCRSQGTVDSTWQGRCTCSSFSPCLSLFRPFLWRGSEQGTGNEALRFHLLPLRFCHEFVFVLAVLC